MKFLPTLILSLLVACGCNTTGTQEGTSDSAATVLKITTLDQWEKETTGRRCVLFVDGNWNPEMVAFRECFAAFSDWSNLQETKALTISIEPDQQDDAWKICQLLWDQIPDARSQHGLKHLGGAGRVVWLDNGNVVDYDWCAFLTNWDSISDIAQMKTRTQANFK